MSEPEGEFEDEWDSQPSIYLTPEERAVLQHQMNAMYRFLLDSMPTVQPVSKEPK